MDTHRSTLSRYNEATRQGVVSLSCTLSPPNLTDRFQENEEMAARCETVLNTTMAEIETYHTQKQEDFQTLTKDHLDGEIALHEQARIG